MSASIEFQSSPVEFLTVNDTGARVYMLGGDRQEFRYLILGDVFACTKHGRFHKVISRIDNGLGHTVSVYVIPYVE